ncbi:MAG: DUF123 domain-containing protein [Verrucomicrobia bacterium]|nr:DUF123 domain-containing protein [Verrucomicrobiota bacterium]
MRSTFRAARRPRRSRRASGSNWSARPASSRPRRNWRCGERASWWQQWEPGHYVYVGSACGPGGLAARLRHHDGIAQRRHWHIDPLRARCQLVAVWFTTDPRRREHAWARKVGRLPGAQVPLPGVWFVRLRLPHPPVLVPRPTLPSVPRRAHHHCRTEPSSLNAGCSLVSDGSRSPAHLRVCVASREADRSTAAATPNAEPAMGSPARCPAGRSPGTPGGGSPGCAP